MDAKEVALIITVIIIFLGLFAMAITDNYQKTAFLTECVKTHTPAECSIATRPR